MDYQISDILSNPALINNVPDEILQAWIAQYPYVSLFHLQALKRKPNYSEKELHKAAFYINNRSKLYFLLHKETSVNSSLVPKQEQEIKTSISPTPVSEEETALAIPTIDVEATAAETLPEPVIEEQPLSIADQILAEIKLRQEAKQQETNVLSQPKEKETAPSVELHHTPEEPQAPEEIITSSQEENNAETTAAISDTSAEKKISIAEQVFGAIQQMKEEVASASESSEQVIISPPAQKEEITEAAQEELPEAATIQEVNTEVTPAAAPQTTNVADSTHTFMEWLKMLDHDLQPKTIDPAADTSDWIEIPRYEVELLQEIKKEEQQQPVPVHVQTQENKLFEPNFDEGEVDLFHEIDEEVNKVASESVSFKQDMMTETLAKIYTKQGKTDKALEIYNALSLKFPEKSAYFAGLIKKIEKGE